MTKVVKSTLSGRFQCDLRMLFFAGRDDNYSVALKIGIPYL